MFPILAVTAAASVQRERNQSFEFFIFPILAVAASAPLPHGRYGFAAEGCCPRHTLIVVVVLGHSYSLLEGACFAVYCSPLGETIHRGPVRIRMHTDRLRALEILQSTSELGGLQKNINTPSMHRRLGSATLSQLAFPWESDPNLLWEKSQMGRHS